MKLKSITNYFTKTEKILWGCSVALIIIAFYFFDRQNYLTLIASLIGITSLIFSAKGNLIGQLLIVIFCLLYGIISFQFAYYGEMITYLGMTMPMAIFALIAWQRHPYNGHKTEVAISHITKKQTLIMFMLALIVTLIFFVILKKLNTSYLFLSTLSVTTSFIAVYLTINRSPYYAIGYAANDIILIGLWILAATENISYISVVICFVTFFVVDIYGFISWQKRGIKQLGN